MKDNIQLILVIALFAYVIVLQQCSGWRNDNQNVLPKNTIDTVSIDTIFPAPIVIHLPKQQMPDPIIIYRDRENITYKENELPKDIDKSTLSKSYNYLDSLTDDNINIYYNAQSEGIILGNNISYKLKIPKEIIKTVEKTTYIPNYEQVSGLFLMLGAGGNPNSFASISVGMQYINKHGWSLAYDYDVLQNIHSAKMGIRIFPFKNKKNK